MRWLGLCPILALAGCYPLGEFVCGADANCVDGNKLGVCQPTGFCSYPDIDCESGERYDDLAGRGLAGACVDPLGGSSSTGAPTATTGEASSSSSDESGPAPTCVDEDGDGWGEGDACEGVDCDDDNAAATDNCVYVGPMGDDAAAGTREAPWLTFAHATAALRPGMSLVVLSGTYELSTHGRLHVDCDNEATSGEVGAPIFVRADDERQAHIETGGADSGIRVDGCAYWRFRGLRVSGGDAPDWADAVLVGVRQSNDIEFRRMLVHDSNRYGGSPLFFVDGGPLLVEDSELYGFYTTGIHVGSAGPAVLRRVYSHGRDLADLPGCVDELTPGLPYCSTSPEGADQAIFAGRDVTVENAIFENSAFGMVASSGTTGLKVLGTVGIGGVHALVFGSQAGEFSRDLVFEHCVGLRASSRTLYLRTIESATVRNLTGIACGNAMRVDLQGELQCSAAGCTMVGTNVLSLESTSDGLQKFDENLGVISYANVFGSASSDYFPTDDPFDDDVGFYQRSTSVAAPRMGTGAGQCIVYVPPDSVMSGAGENGEDIGANVLYRYRDGVLTDEPLWDAATGSFPCGAVVPGVNDDPATSCIGVHERLHVGTEGCPLPY